MKTKITNGSAETGAVRHAGGITKIRPGQTKTLEGVEANAERRAELEGQGWAFEDQAPPKPRKAKAKDETAEE